MNEVQKEIDLALQAVEKKPLFPQYLNRYNGEVSPYKTPANYKPSDGLLNTGEDLCHVEDYVSIQQIYARLKSMRALSVQDSEFAYDERNLNTDDLEEEFASDDADIAEDALDGFEIQESIANKYGNNGQKTSTEELDAEGATEGATPSEGATEGAPDAS